MRRSLTSLTAALFLSLAVAGCSPFGGACPAIGWLNSAKIIATGAASLQVCILDRCVTSGGEASRDDQFSIQTSAAGSYEVEFRMARPSSIAVTGFDAAGTEIAREKFDLVWTRTGGSEQCGGPASTPTITLTI